MDSDIHNHRHNQQPQENMNSGLTRYRSAPSSYFSNLINSGVYGDEDLDPFFNAPISSPETEKILSRFISGDNVTSHRNLEDEFVVSMKPEHVNFSSQEQQQQQMLYQNHVESQEVVRNNNSTVVGRINPPTNLLRQSSSPAGFFEHNNIDNGYHMMRLMDKFPPADVSVPMAFSSCSGSGSGLGLTSRQLSRIPEGKTMAHNNGGYVASFPGSSWDESSLLNDGFLKEFAETDQITSSENQENLSDEGRIQPVHAHTDLTHQLSLPTSSTELSVKEKLLQFQDNVPLRSRAKRGCATHPRSIAERVRRTRISERMRKLQDLVPNMDKQTSTADMLDLAVDYIKELQNQVETLSDCRTKCKCSNKLRL